MTDDEGETFETGKFLHSNLIGSILDFIWVSERRNSLSLSCSNLNCVRRYVTICDLVKLILYCIEEIIFIHVNIFIEKL